MRNAQKQIELGKKLVGSNRSLTAGEICQIMDIVGSTSQQVFDAIAEAFYFGVAVGNRIPKTEGINK